MVIMRHLTRAALLAFVTLLAACGIEGPEAAAGPELAGTMWQLSALNGEPPLEGTTITLEFGDTDVGGSAGCNQYGGSYELDGQSLTIGELFRTEMACMEPAGVMEQENAYLSALSEVASVRQSDGQLELLGADGNVLLTYVEQQPPADASLEGTAWTLESFVEGDAVSSTVAGTTATINFAGGTVTGNTGCNEFGGSYTVDGNSITLTEIVSTLVACEDPPGVMDQEERFLDILNNVSSYEIDGNRLTLSTDDGHGLSFRAR